MILQHNLQAANIKRQLGMTNRALSKTTEKLSSGYRINRAADDAARMQISEKKRAQIRGLVRSVKNAEEGIGFIQVGDGAMSEAHNILHRMEELCVQSSNDTYTDAERAVMQMEFDALQSEIDKINDQTEYNTLPVFEHYNNVYYAYQGNRIWSQDQLHSLVPPDNSLTVTYQITSAEPEQTITFTVPPGNYTTQELMDEMDTVITDLGTAANGLYLEYTREGTCNMVLQNGEQISRVSGGLSYLFYDEYIGSQTGSLIGTTVFDPNFPLIIDERNNHMICSIENLDGTSQSIDITLDSGAYTRQDMIDYLNRKLDGTGMTASEYGDYSIQLGSEDGIITGLKGNMFLIDDAGDVMVSVFYDNTKYGSVEKTPAKFTGGAVLMSGATNISAEQFHIDNTNNILKIKVNGDDSQPYTEITLDAGDYTISAMVSHLQSKLRAAGCDVTVGTTNKTVLTPNGNRLFFYGITIQSNQVGWDSSISFDIDGSTAYDTLFVDRKYTDPGRNVQTSPGQYAYTRPSATGSKKFEADNLPVEITTANNSFRITVQEKGFNTDGSTASSFTSNTYTITIPTGTYTSLTDIINAINEKISSDASLTRINGKILAEEIEGAIRLKPTEDNRSVTNISFASTTTPPYAAGYDALFVGKRTVTSTQPVSSTGTQPTITLDYFDPTMFDGSNNTIPVNVNGNIRPVVIPPGNYSPDDIEHLLEIIRDQLRGTTTAFPNSFSAEGYGSTVNRNINRSEHGTITSRGNISCNQTGSGGMQDGSTAIVNPQPARYTVPVALKSSTTVTAENSTFSITVNSHTYTVDLEPGDYSPEQLRDALNTKLNDAITGQANKVTVGLTTGNQLQFTTNSKGSGITMSFSDETSSLLYSINHEKTPAVINTGLTLQDNITIADSSNTFTVTVDGAPRTVTLTNGPYTSSSFLTELTQKLDSIGVVPSLQNGALTLATKEANGSNSTLAFNTNDGNGGSAISAIFGNMIKNTPATAALATPLHTTPTETTPPEDVIVIQDGNGVFQVDTVQNGTPQTHKITIPDGQYTKDELISKMNDLFGGSVRVAANEYGSLSFSTMASGNGTSIKVNHEMNSVPNSASSAIFGETVVTTPDIDVDLDPNGNLVLTGSPSGSGYTISVRPGENSAVLKPVEKIQNISPATVSGNVTIKYYTLNSSTPLSGGITITDQNKDLKFTYYYPQGTPPNQTQAQRTVIISLDERDYSPDDLQTALQNKINDALGDSAALAVTASDAGIQIKSQNAGINYSLTFDRESGFYKYVLLGTRDIEQRQETSYREGTQLLSDTYIIGRKDIRNNPVNIRQDSNDKLSIDVTINDTVHTLDIIISPGQYDTQSLLRELQSKIDEQVIEKGLPEHSVLVDVGRFDSGVVGANDANSLDIYINPDVDLEVGNYRIDGLTGSSLFEIFYKTTGDLIPAYITGTKDISNGVTIDPENTELSLDVDGVTYTYTIPEGEYTTEEFIETLKNIFDAPDNNGNTALITPSFSGNALKISSKKLGNHSVENIQGSAKAAIFYSSNGRKDYDSTLYLQVGANANQLLELQRFSISTISLGINSITVSKTKYAQKALGRIHKAIDNLSVKRSTYGAKQNRLDHTVDSNNNTQENLQASEATDRDANIALEMVELSKRKIIQQAGMSMMAQANRNPSSALTLLQ